MIAADQARAVSVARDEPGVDDVQTFGERAHVRFSARAGADALARLTSSFAAAGVTIRSLRDVPPSLEDVFIARLQEQGAATWDGDPVPPGPGAGISPPHGRADS